jgi:predicted O-methyltransferase YrrM
MSTVFTTSYSNSHLQTKIIDFVKNTNPKLVIEIGTQQGASAILIGKALAAKSKIITIDSFESEYIEPPYAKTHANFKITISNLEKANLVCE